MLPQLLIKKWSGESGEYFTWLDMNRVEYNANIVAREAGVSEVEFIETLHSSQFRYDEAQKLEDLEKATAEALGLTIEIESAWSYNRTLSYVDFERWEANLWSMYEMLGGVGERVDSDKFIITVNAILYASKWNGTGPYYMDLDVPSLMAEGDAVAFVSHTATVLQRMAEYNAVLRASQPADRKMRIWAQSIKPSLDIPIKIMLGVPKMHEEISLPVSGWSGSGPWTQTVTVSSGVSDAVIGTWEGMTDAAVKDMMESIVSVSAVSGASVTIRAIGKKPEVALNPVLMWNGSAVV